MDSSSRLKNLEIISGRAKVFFHEIAYDEMAELLFGVVLQKAKPVLKYLPRFETIGSSLNCQISGLASRITDSTLPQFPLGVSEKTKVFLIATLDQAETGSTIIRRHLLVTDEAELLLWSATYHRRPAPLNRNSDEIAQESCFTLLTRLEVQGFYSQSHLWPKNWKDLMFEVIRCLARLTKEGVENREKYLASMRDVDNLLRGILSRIAS